MTREDAARLWPIIKAFGEGETVQIYESSVGKWYDIVECPTFTASPDTYRIKPKPVKVTLTYKPGGSFVSLDGGCGVAFGVDCHLGPGTKTITVELPE